MTYFLAPGYRERLEPEYFHDEGMDAVWQPDVYPEAAALGRVLGATKIVDLGCGDGSKLAALHPEFEIVGIDVGANLERARSEHEVGTWVELDLDSDEPLPLDDVADALFVCADVLEHLVRPEKTLQRVRDVLERGAAAFVVSTPERDLAEGPGHLGPPRNPAHVREWNTDELRRLLESCGLDAFYGLTRSNDYLNQLLTTFAVVPGEAAGRRRVVELWFRAREPWQAVGVDQAAKLAAERDRVAAFATAIDWYKGELETHRRELDECQRQLEHVRGYASDLEDQLRNVSHAKGGTGETVRALRRPAARLTQAIARRRRA